MTRQLMLGLAVIVLTPVPGWSQQVYTVAGHEGSVSKVMYSPDNKWLATGGSDGNVHLWDAAKRVRVGSFNAHSGYVMALAFSPDSKLLATGGVDRKVFVWDLAKFGKRSDLAKVDGLAEFLPAPDGKSALYRKKSGELIFRNLDDGKQRGAWKLPGNPQAPVAWMANGQEIVVGSPEKIVRLRVDTGKQVDELVPINPWKDVTALAVSNNSQWVMVGTSDGKIEGYRFPDKNKAKPRWTHTEGGSIQKLQTGYRNQRIAGFSSNGKIFLLDQNSGYTKLAQEVAKPTCIDVAVDGRKCIVGTASGEARYYEEGQRIPTKAWKASSKPITGVHFGLEMRSLIIGDAEGVVTTWTMPYRQNDVLKTGQIKHGRPILTVEGVDNLGFALIDDTGAGEIRWTPGLNRRELGGQGGSIHALAFSPDGKLLASGSADNSVLCWDTENYKQKFKSSASKNQVYSLCFTKDSKQLISGDADASVKLLAVQNGKEEKDWSEAEDSVYAIAIHPDGRRFFAGGVDKALRVYDLKQKKVISSWADAPDEIYGLDLNQKGSRLATIGYGGTLRVWDTSNGRVLFRHKFPVECYSVSYRPDGAQLAVARGNGDILFVELPKFVR